jgi:hypothetical protein
MVSRLKKLPKIYQLMEVGGVEGVGESDYVYV